MEYTGHKHARKRHGPPCWRTLSPGEMGLWLGALAVLVLSLDFAVSFDRSGIPSVVFLVVSGIIRLCWMGLGYAALHLFWSRDTAPPAPTRALSGKELENPVLFRPVDTDFVPLRDQRGLERIATPPAGFDFDTVFAALQTTGPAPGSIELWRYTGANDLLNQCECEAGDVFIVERFAEGASEPGPNWKLLILENDDEFFPRLRVPYGTQPIGRAYGMIHCYIRRFGFLV